MKYPASNSTDVLCCITYGSHLYGTNTPTSDHDFKVITLPPYRDLILAKPLTVQRFRFDAAGAPVGPHSTMPDNGYEAEHVPVQKFVHDYLGGQAYAVELVFAVLHNAHKYHFTSPARNGHFTKLCETLSKQFAHQNVNGMAGYAKKQIFDYVHRGERLNSAKAVMNAVYSLRIELGITNDKTSSVRLDTKCFGHTILDELVSRTGIQVGSVQNNKKMLRTLKLNGRDYLETSSLVDFCTAVEKLVHQYGVRSLAAAETEVDWKSLSHAIRVYQQVIEYLKTSWITFPRPNTADLIDIKQGRAELERVKSMLIELDSTSQQLISASELLVLDNTMRELCDDMLFNWIQELYQQENVKLMP